jgi:hypothetical protein
VPTSPVLRHAVHSEYNLLRLSYAFAAVLIPPIILQEPTGSKKTHRARRHAIKQFHDGLHPAAQSAQAARVQLLRSRQLARVQVHLEAILHKCRDKMFPYVYGVSLFLLLLLGPS